MTIEPLPAAEDAVDRYVRELWLPYNRDLESIVDDFSLDDQPEDAIVAAETEFRLDHLESGDQRICVAVEDDGESEDGDRDHRNGATESETDTDIAATDGEFVGFVTTSTDEAPPVFDRPDRLIVCDIYVRGSHRGTGLAHELMARAADRAREAGCPELALDVDVGNDRALAFYRKLGFETYRRRMGVAVEDLERRQTGRTSTE